MHSVQTFARPDNPAVPTPPAHAGLAHMRRVANPTAWLLLGGLTVGAVDMLSAVIYWGREDVTPEHVLQSVTVWVAGPAAFAGGLGSALLGAVLYGLLMWGVVALYYAMARKWSQLFRRPLLCGGIYGALTYLAIFQIMVPILTGARAHDLVWIATCIVVYTTLVGMPCALFARAAANARSIRKAERQRDAAR